MPHSSRGLGHSPLKAEIIGSNPICGTNSPVSDAPDRAAGAFYVLAELPPGCARCIAGCRPSVPSSVSV